MHFLTLRLQRFCVVPEFVAKELAEHFESPPVAYQPVPEVMAGLMAQIPELRYVSPSSPW
jgi:hypothetical protein